MLRGAGVGDAQELRQRGHVPLAAPDLLDDPEPGSKDAKKDSSDEK
jgi:hypothetical protein